MLRVYEHNGLLHLRDGRSAARIPIEPERIQEAKMLLNRMDSDGKLRFITLRNILEE